MYDSDDSSYLDIEAWQRGIDREESFRRIFQHHYRRVYVIFAKWGFGDIECEDLAQEVFLRVHRNLASFRGDSTFETWLYQICNNVRRNIQRSRGTQKRDAQEVPLGASVLEAPYLEVEVSEDPSPLSQFLREERRAALRDALQALPPQMRRCIELRVDHDLKYREIAEQMHISIDTVKAHLFQARYVLKQRLEKFEEPPLLVETPGAATAKPQAFTSHNVGPRIELNELVERFLRTNHTEVPHTMSAYRRHLQGFLSFLNGLPITASVLSGYSAQLLSDGRGKASHLQALAAVRSFLSWLVTTQGKASSLPPLLDIQRILRMPESGQEQPRSSPITREEAEALLRCAPTLRDRVMLGLLLKGGLKVNELVRLRVENFRHRGSGLFVTVKARTVPLPPDVGEFVSLYLEETERTWKSPGLLLLHLPRRGGRLSPNGMLTNRAVEYRLRQLLTIAGLADREITPHSLRQTYAAEFLQKEGDIKALKERLGHVSVGTTERYLRLLPYSDAK